MIELRQITVPQPELSWLVLIVNLITWDMGLWTHVLGTVLIERE